MGDASPHAPLYRTARWKRLRLAVLARLGWQCRMCGAMLCGGRINRAGALRSAVVDHIVPHRGCAQLFHDPANLQVLCKECHDSAKARAEAIGYDDAVDEDGWPVDPAHPAGGVGGGSIPTTFPLKTAVVLTLSES